MVYVHSKVWDQPFFENGNDNDTFWSKSILEV